ncbi:hypothetical protein BKA70DRAFT_816839 [Coprinopsis sp. MPI-PUGE-AT-0042]|nr:hypothetical protein BKA70DRAFT_816839 [Coprinopsis sp. MPI-PUGE-AT-0042]
MLGKWWCPSAIPACLLPGIWMRRLRLHLLRSPRSCCSTPIKHCPSPFPLWSFTFSEQPGLCYMKAIHFSKDRIPRSTPLFPHHSLTRRPAGNTDLGVDPNWTPFY